MTYKTVTGKNGVRYMKDNRFVAKADIPADVLVKLNVGMEVDDTPVEKEPLVCIFCGLGTKITRFLNQQTIAVCEEHYYSKNVGQTVQQFNIVNGVVKDDEDQAEEQGDSQTA